MITKAVRSVIYGQVCLYGGLLVCVLLMPEGLSTNDGISYYGIHERTFFPYAIALIGSAFFLLRAASHMNGSPELKIMRRAFTVYAPLVIGIVVTPYSAGWLMDYLHTAFGAALFALQLLLSIWLIARLHLNRIAVTLTLIEFFSGVVSAIYLSPVHGYLLQSQVAFQLAFGILVIYCLKKLPVPEPLTAQDDRSK